MKFSIKDVFIFRSVNLKPPKGQSFFQGSIWTKPSSQPSIQK